MNKVGYLIFHLLVISTGIGTICYSIRVSRWFSFWENALSDLGNPLGSQVAFQFNSGLLLTGLLIILAAVNVIRRYSRFSWLLFASSGFLLQMVATFSEVYGYIHFLISVTLFASFGLTMLADSLELKNRWILSLFLLYVPVWPTYFLMRSLNVFRIGASIPELISITFFLIWFVTRSIRILRTS